MRVYNIFAQKLSVQLVYFLANVGVNEAWSVNAVFKNILIEKNSSYSIFEMCIVYPNIAHTFSAFET